MVVYKFGGASVKDANAVQNLLQLLQNHGHDKMIIVISAMAKTTNALEKVVQLIVDNDPEYKNKIEEVISFHWSIAQELFTDDKVLNIVDREIRTYFNSVQDVVNSNMRSNYDFVYDQVVCIGELLSTRIVSRYLNEQGIANSWLDARTVIKTDYNYREANVDWVRTKTMINTEIDSRWTTGNPPIVTQGFIAGADNLNYTTLGREGSDFSAAIFAYATDAEKVVIWKDVPGVLNADPKYFPNAERLDKINYREAVELAYYGASVIHPKTIQPLQNKNIPLWVKSFLHPEGDGTIIQSDDRSMDLPASYIFKKGQQLISFRTRDFSFIAEDHLREIFDAFSRFKVKINMMQNSAINFSVCVDESSAHLTELLEELNGRFEIRYNTGLELLTIRHYEEQIIAELCAGKKNMMEQRTRHTYRVVLKS